MDIKKASDCSSLEEIRHSIDHIDNQIVELIAMRGEYVKEAAKFKKSETAVRDPNRVEQVIESKKQLATQYGTSPQLIETIYRTLIDFFIKEETTQWQKQIRE